MKRTILMSIVIWVFAALIHSVEAQQQSNQERPRAETAKSQQSTGQFVKYMGDEHGKRVKLLKDSDYMGIAVKALAERTGKRTDDPVFFVSVGPGIMGFACTSNVFWKGDMFQEATFSDYIARIFLVPQKAEDEWTVAITKVNGGEIQKMYNLGSVILQDRLFDKTGFRHEESIKLLNRLNSIPQEAIIAWAESRQLENYQAAISLINLESLFSKEVLQQSLFTKKLKEIAPK